jgi:hypothetical protein
MSPPALLIKQEVHGALPEYLDNDFGNVLAESQRLHADELTRTAASIITPINFAIPDCMMLYERTSRRNYCLS